MTDKALALHYRDDVVSMSIGVLNGLKGRSQFIRFLAQSISEVGDKPSKEEYTSEPVDAIIKAEEIKIEKVKKGKKGKRVKEEKIVVITPPKM